MKIIQSYWSKPVEKTHNINLHDRNQGGWLDSRYHLMSWALSCLQFRKFYTEVELYTDLAGKELLIDLLQLPYTKVHIVLDRLSSFPQDLWAVGKMYTYSLQQTPFVHADGDVYIWQPFSESLTQAALIAQNEEVNFEYYYSIMEEVKEKFNYIPSCLQNNAQASNIIYACNAGIFGGRDIAFFQTYCRAAFEFIEKNWNNLEKINLGLFNIIVEQYLFASLAREKQVNITYLLENVDTEYSGLAEFRTVPSKTKFIHTVGKYKQNGMICHRLANRLQIDYPEYYEKILAIFQYKDVDLALVNHNLENIELQSLNNLLLNKSYLKNIFNQSVINNAKLFMMSNEEFIKKLFMLSKITVIVDEETPAFSQTLFYIKQSITRVDFYIDEKILDSFEMVVLDSFASANNILAAFKEIRVYFEDSTTEVNENLLALLISKVKDYLELGILVLKNNRKLL